MRLSSNSPPHTINFGNDIMNALLAKAMWLISTVVGSVTEIEDEAVPETAAAHCNIHWTILCIIAMYGIYAIARVGRIRKALAGGIEDMGLSPEDLKKQRGFFHYDTLIGLLALALLALSKYFWTCYIDYRVAVCGAVIVIISTVIIEIENYRLFNRVEIGP